MKSKTLKTILVLIVGMFSVLSCNETLEEINQDPNAFNTTSPENQLAGVVKNSARLIYARFQKQVYYPGYAAVRK